MKYEEILDHVRKIYFNNPSFKSVSVKRKLKSEIEEFDSLSSLLMKAFKTDNLSKILEFIETIKENINKIIITYSFDTYMESKMLNDFLKECENMYNQRSNNFTQQKKNFISLSMTSKRFYNDMLDIVNKNNLVENSHRESMLENQPSYIRFKIEVETISDWELLSQNLPQIQRKKLKLEK